MIYQIDISARPRIAGAHRRAGAAVWRVPGRCGLPLSRLSTIEGTPHRGARAPAIVLELGELAWAGVPCWTGRADRWARFTVPVAYDLRYDTHVRPVMGDNQVSRCAANCTARWAWSGRRSTRHGHGRARRRRPGEHHRVVATLHPAAPVGGPQPRRRGRQGRPTAAQLAAAQKATRPAKPEQLAWAQLRQLWREDARGLRLHREALSGGPAGAAGGVAGTV